MAFVDSGETRTVDSGSTGVNAALEIGGQLDLAGEFWVFSNLPVAATSSGDGFGTASTTVEKQATASGFGAGYGRSTSLLTVASGTTETVPAGAVRNTHTVEVGGQLDLAGELNIVEQIGIASRESRRIASGFGDGFGAAVANPEYRVTASGFGDGFGTASTTEEYRATASGFGDGLGTAVVSPVYRTIAAGIGNGFGTAVANPEYRVTASGFGDGFGTASTTVEKQATASGFGAGYGRSTPLLTVASGTTETVPAGAVRNTYTVEVGGQLDLAGELNIGEQIGIASRESRRIASGFGDGFGAAVANPEYRVTASGFGDGFGTAVFTKLISLLRPNTARVEFDDTDANAITYDDSDTEGITFDTTDQLALGDE